MRIGVVGSRTLCDYEWFANQMDNLVGHSKTPIQFVSGGADGPDTMIERYARERGHPDVCVHTPNWNQEGWRAGFNRNSDIVADCDAVIAFWDERSAGTRDTINKCRRAFVPVLVITFNPNQETNELLFE
ncbi:GTP-binding domain [Acidovorax phage ACP17]|uniref:DUF2493 domain-containing protein n=1 Tax=Acidovorax phage ACP17 TaxID=2010329 RepID=A0A218M364_9CAUD|nr:GTP-binding domain [Acidovorax phage ACP17]ASD50478.1 hypothetical protein [Acidovorax phage ACP17]